MNTDVLIHKILKGINDVIKLNWVDDPYMVYPFEYKYDEKLLYVALKQIVNEELVTDFEIAEYDANVGLKLNLIHASISKRGVEIAEMSNFAMKRKLLFNKVFDTYNKLQDELGQNVDKYESYSDQKLIQMVKSNSFRNPSHRAIVYKILAERGYTK